LPLILALFTATARLFRPRRNHDAAKASQHNSGYDGSHDDLLSLSTT
jgi:hypothetical protein